MSRPIARRRLLAGAAAITGGAVVGATLVGCTPELPRLRIAGGEPGGSYAQFAQLLAEAAIAVGIADRVEAVTTAGSVTNLEQLQAGEVDLAVSLIDSAAAAPAGLAAVGRVYQNYLQCLVLADGPVTRVADLAGRRISIGARGSGTARTSQRVLDLLAVPGLTRVQRSLAQAVDELVAGSVAAMMWSGGIPLPVLVELRDRVRLLDLTAALDRLGDAYAGLYHRTLVPAGVYAGPDATPSIGIANLLLARTGADERLVADVVDLLVTDADRLVPSGSVGLQYLTPGTLIDTAPIPLHPAAAARYRHHYS